MDTNSDQPTTFQHLFGSEPATDPAPASADPAAQPTPPDVETYQAAVTETPAQPAQLPGQEAPPQQPQSHSVPLATFIEMRKEAQEAKEAARQTQAQLAELTRRMIQPQQPQSQPIDPEIDPAGAYHALANHFNQALQTQNITFSRARAAEKFGETEVVAAANAAHEAGLANVFATHADPFASVMNWYKGEQLRQTIGTDPVAYQKKLEAKIMARLKQGTPPPGNLPPSLSSATRTNPASPEVLSSDKDFFNQMMNRKRRS